MVRNFAELRGPIRDAFPRGTERLRPAEYVVQRYATKPLLVDGYKFDCRCYVVVTGIVPLRAYLFDEGLARFCTTKYEKPRGRNLGNSCMHLTNYAVNKHSDAFNGESAHDAGSKRSLSSVFALIESEGGPRAEVLWAEIRGLAEKTILALRPALVEHMSHGEHGAFYPAGPKGFHILGFDILFDEKYRPILIELNANSSLSVTQPVAVPEPDKSAADSSDAAVKSEVSELDLAVKAELISQALLVANPLRHRLALQGRIAWCEVMNGSRRLPMGTVLAADEPIPLDDDGHPVHESATLTLPRPDRPDKCPALRPLEFERHEAFGHVQNQLQAYRIWRHFSFNPPGSCAVKVEQTNRRYLGFGAYQFRQLCDAAGLVPCNPRRFAERGLPAVPDPCWPDRIAADLFWARCAGDEQQIALDFPRFLRRIALPVGEALSSDSGGMRDPLRAFIARMVASSSHQIGGISPRGGPYSEEEDEECEDSFADR